MSTEFFYAWILVYFFFIPGISSPIKELSSLDICLTLYGIAHAFPVVFLILFCLTRPDKSCGHLRAGGVQDRRKKEKHDVYYVRY